MSRETPEHAHQHVNEDRLINLLNGLLPTDEQHAGLAHLKQCALCEARFQQLAGERERLVAGAQPRALDGRIVMHQTTRAPRRTQRVWLGGLSAAAALVLLFAGSAWWQSRHPALEYWLPVDQPEALLRSTPPSETADSFLAALTAYRERDARRALDLLQSARVDADERALRDLYLASALVLNQRYVEADSVLARLGVQTLPQPWRRQAQWVQYISLRSTTQSERAMQLLETLVDEPGDIGARARREYDRLQPEFSVK